MQQRGGSSETSYAWHSTGNSNAVTNILDKGIDPNYLNPNSRFGKAFYVAEQPSTSLAEMSHYGVDPSTGIRFSIQTTELKILDLTIPSIAKQWGYIGGDKSLQMQRLGEKAKESGFNAIRFGSEREFGGVNIAVLNDFNKVLKPEMVTPVPK
jgi:filamentous hemagglutinin